MMRGAEAPIFYRPVDIAESSAHTEILDRSITAVVVEDEPKIRELIDLALGCEGVKVLGQFASKKEFFEFAGIIQDSTGEFSHDPSKSKLNGDKPDLVVTDLKIEGEGATVGYDIARAAKKVFGSYNVLESASAEVCSEEERQKMGINDFVSKPFDPFQLASDAIAHVKQARNQESQKAS